MAQYTRKIQKHYLIRAKTASDFSDALNDDPFYEKIKEYVIGDSATTHEEAPSIKDPQAASFKKKFDSLYMKAKAPKTLTLYRSHVLDDIWELGEGGVLDGYTKLLSCTDSKNQALSLAETRAESDRDSGDYDDDDYFPTHYVLELKNVSADRIYFHHRLDKKTAAHHVQEQEVLIDPNNLKFKVLAVFGD